MSTTFTKKLLLTGTAIVAVSCIAMGQAHAQQVVGANVAITDGDGATAGVTFNGDFTGTAADGQAIGGPVITNTNNTGTLQFDGASTVTGAIGTTTPDAKLKEIIVNGGAGKTVTLNGNTFTNTLTIANGGTITGTGEISAGQLTNTAGTTTISNKTAATNVTVTAGSLTLSDTGSVINGTAALNSGTLVFSGASIVGPVTGTGTLNLNGANTQSVTGAVAATDLNLSGAGVTTLSGAVTTTGTLSSTGADNVISGKLEAAAVTVTGNKLTVSDATSTVSGATAISNGATLDFSGASLTSVTGTGTLNLSGANQAANTIGAAGAGNALTTLNLNGSGTKTLNNAVYATTTNIANGVTVDAKASINGSVVFKGDGTLELANDAGLVGNANTITTETTETGTLTIAGASLPENAVAIDGAVGSSTHKLKAVNIGAGNVNFGGELHTKVINFTGASSVNLSSTGTSTHAQGIGFGANNAAVTFGNNVNFTGTVTNDADKGQLTFGNDATIGVALGATHKLNSVTLGGGTNTINHNISASAINLGTGTTEFTDGITLSGAVTGGATNILNVGSKALTIADGDFTTVAGQRLNFSVSSSTTAGKINTGTNNAIIHAGTLVDVKVDTNEYIADGNSYTLIDGNDAGTGVATLTTLTTQSNTALLTFKQDTTKKGDLVITASRAQAGGQSQDPSNKSVGAMLGQVGGSGDAAVTDLQVRLQNESTAAGVDAILSTLVPDLSGGAVASTVGTSNMTGGIVGGRVNALRGGDSSYGTGVSSGNMLESGHIWAQGFGGTSDQDNRDGVAGYDADTVGMVFGVDTDITDSIRAGIALAYANTDVDGDNASRTNTDIDSYQVMVYGDMDLSNNYFVSGQLAYLYNDIDTTRYNVGGLAGNTARADFHSNQYVARAELGRDFAMDHGITLTPSALVNYNYIDTSSYTEKGAGGLGLSNVESDDMHILEFGVNVMGSADFNDGHGGLVTPNLHAGYRYDVIGDSVATTAGLVGAGNAAFKTEGFDPSQHTVNVGTGIQWTTANNLDLSINYDYEHKSDYDAHSGYVRAGFKF